MRFRTLLVIAWLFGSLVPFASGQGSSSGGSTFSPTTGNSLTAGSTTMGAGGAGATGLQGIESGKAVEIREGFLNPTTKSGFLMPSNTSTTARGRTSGSTTARATTTSSRATGLNSLRGLGGLSGARGTGSQFGTGAQTGANGAAAPLRIPMRMAIPENTVQMQPTVLARFQQRVTKLPGFDLATGVQVNVEDRTMVLRGTVASSHQREMLQRLALLEPGVSSVRNELTVDASNSMPEVLPATPPVVSAP